MSKAVKMALVVVVVLLIAFLIFVLWGHGEGGSAVPRASLAQSPVSASPSAPGRQDMTALLDGRLDFRLRGPPHAGRGGVHAGDPEDPGRVPLRGRLVGRPRRAAPARAGGEPGALAGAAAVPMGATGSPAAEAVSGPRRRVAAAGAGAAG